MYELIEPTLSIFVWLQQVPQVAIQVLKNGNCPIYFFFGRPHKFDIPSSHLFVIPPEVVCEQEKENAATRLIAHPFQLLFIGCFGKQ